MADSVKTIAVTGATGTQGGAVINALQRLAPTTVHIRGITRNPDSEAAKALIARGVEVVKADFDCPDELPTVFQSCDAAFLVTNFWEYIDKDREIRQAKSLGDACVKAGVKHFVYSALEDTKSDVGHFDGKAEAVRCFFESNMPATALITSFYHENWINGVVGFQRNDNGTIAVTWPAKLLESTVPSQAVEDIGTAAARLLLDGPAAWAGKSVGIVADNVSIREACAEISKLTGKTIEVMGVDEQLFRKALAEKIGEAAAKDLTNMYEYFARKNGAYSERSITTTLHLVPDALTFKAWAEAHKAELTHAVSG